MAVPVPGKVGRSLWGQLAPYRAVHPDVRWLRAGTWHLTLVFIGSVGASSVPRLTELIDEVASRTGPWTLSLEGGGGRGHDGDAVAWLRTRAGARELIATAEDLDGQVTRLDHPALRPRRTPAAHLTVARRADQGLIESLRAQDMGELSATWTVDRIALVRSHLDGAGARYETLHEARCTLPPDE